MRQLKNSGAASIDFQELDKILRNSGVQQFSYETFAAQFDADPRLKTIITNFDKEQIRFKQDATDGLPGGGDGGNTVSQMAKRATNVGNTL